MKTIINKINNVFKNIPNIHNDTKTINTRNNKLSISECVHYLFKYSNINTTKQSISSDFNFKNKIKSVDRTAFYKKEKNIHIDLYKTIYSNISTIYNDLHHKNYLNFNKMNNLFNHNYVDIKNIFGNDFKALAGDGTNNNTVNKGILYTNQYCVLYDVINNVSYDKFNDNFKSFYFKNNKNNISNKNGEVNHLISFIESHKNDLKNIIFILDRAYFKYELFDILQKYNLYYIIRLQDSCKIIDVNYIPPINDKNYKFIINIKANNNVKIIEYKREHIKEIVSNTNKIKKIKINDSYHLITNLGNYQKCTDEIIDKLYKSRWNIEVFFKSLKSNHKFNYYKNKNTDEHEKLFYINLIMEMIVKILIYYSMKRFNLFNMKKTKIKNNVEIDINLNVNISNLCIGVYDKLLKNIINGNLYVNLVNKFITSYFIINKNEQNRSFIRKSLMPFSKWYIKMYSNINKYKKIIEAIENNTINDLDKNLKILAKKMTII